MHCRVKPGNAEENQNRIHEKAPL
ncbi:MAG: hypothetical protein QOJ15_10590, partial [Bradyrhizobium sp.]|nr:hypothetical protein [Bradyrhizobium sp.]